MFNAGTFEPEIFQRQQRPFDHNLDGLEPYIAAHHAGHSLPAGDPKLLDEVPLGMSFAEQLREVLQAGGLGGLGGTDAGGVSDELLRRLTMERRRSVSAEAVVQRRAVSEDERSHAASTTLRGDDTETPEGTISRPKLSKGEEPVLPSEATPTKRARTIVRSLTAPLPAPATQTQRTSSDEARAFLRTDMPRELLINWFLQRIDNIKILSSASDAFSDKGDDFELLRLLASTHQDKRWWTIMVDDLACPQCVEMMRARRTAEKVRYLAPHPRKRWGDGPQQILSPSCWRRMMAKASGTVHRDGGRFKIVCEHRHPGANNITRFFDKLGKEAAGGINNILLDTAAASMPSADHLVSCIQALRYYFPNIQDLEICFHFVDLKKDVKMDKDTWTKILFCLVDLESLLPKDRHLRARGLECCDELMLGWARKKRKWHAGREGAGKKQLRRAEGRDFHHHWMNR